MSIKKTIGAVATTLAFVASVALPGALVSAQGAETEIFIEADCTGVLAWGAAPEDTVNFTFSIPDPTVGGTQTEVSSDLDNFEVEDLTCLPRSGWTVTSELSAFTNNSYYLEADVTIQTQVIVDMGTVWVNGAWNSGYTFVFSGDHTNGSYPTPPQVAQTPPGGNFNEVLDGRGTTEFASPPWAGQIPISITINDLLTVADGTYTGTLTFTLAAKV